MSTITAEVTAPAGVNIRVGPATTYSIIRLARFGEVFEVIESFGEWIKVRVENRDGFVFAQYVTLSSASDIPGYLIDQPDLMNASLKPDNVIPISALSGIELTLANTWNNCGGLIMRMSDLLQIASSLIVGTLVAESGGRTLGADGRLVIRFENHVFYHQWGRHNDELFDRHFRFDESAPRNNWKNHEWRPSVDAPWRFCHSNQDTEWEVFTFARGFDDAAAKRSISMGAAQVMGFNHQRIGYESASEMFDAFMASPHAQILAMLDYVKGGRATSPALKSLQQRDYLAFASAYNGTANATNYATIIQRNVEVFERLMVQAVPAPSAPPVVIAPAVPPAPVPTPVVVPPVTPSTPAPIGVRPDAPLPEAAVQPASTGQVWQVIAPAGIRVRSAPSLSATPITRLAVWTRFTQTGELVSVDGYLWCPHSQGFSAVQEVDGDSFAEPVLTPPVTASSGQRGIHLDVRHPLGRPTVEQLGGIEWVRIPYDVSFEQGRTDIDSAFQFYEPICKPLLQAGKRVIFVLTHETFGENTQGLPVVRPAEFAAFVARIVQQWQAYGSQIVWEVWNEPDLAYNNPDYNPSQPAASVPLSPAAFANVLALTVRAIRAVDPDAVIISGGLMRGHPNYIGETLAHLPADIRLDGIGIHPYGQDPGSDPRFGPFGNLIQLMRGYQQQSRGIPLYITEWGVLDHPEFPIELVAEYASRFFAASSALAKCAIWYAWADTMHNGYGIVNSQSGAKGRLFDIFTK